MDKGGDGLWGAAALILLLGGKKEGGGGKRPDDGSFWWIIPVIGLVTWLCIEPFSFLVCLGLFLLAFVVIRLVLLPGERRQEREVDALFAEDRRQFDEWLAGRRAAGDMVDWCPRCWGTGGVRDPQLPGKGSYPCMMCCHGVKSPPNPLEPPPPGWFRAG